MTVNNAEGHDQSIQVCMHLAGSCTLCEVAGGQNKMFESVPFSTAVCRPNSCPHKHQMQIQTAPNGIYLYIAGQVPM